MKRALAFLLAILATAHAATVVIIPASLRDPANMLAKAEFDSVGGEFTFTAPLITPPGTNTTHYWCAANFSATNRTKLDVFAATPPFAGNVIILDYDAGADPGAPFRLLTTNGLAVYQPPLAP